MMEDLKWEKEVRSRLVIRHVNADEPEEEEEEDQQQEEEDEELSIVEEFDGLCY